MKGSPAFGTGFCQYERTMWEVEGCEIVAATELCSDRLPVKPASDHQVQHHPDSVIEFDGDPFANAVQERTACPSISSTDGRTVRKRNGLAKRAFTIA